MSPNPDSQREPSREELIALVAAQAAEIAALKARIAELERRLGLNSSNSGKPPSSDGLKKPPRPARTKSLRGPSNKPSGGQKGHKGETLEQVAVPDHVIDHAPPSCEACGSAMTLEMTVGHSARQVFDLPAPAPLIVTEHRAHDCQCGRAYAYVRQQGGAGGPGSGAGHAGGDGGAVSNVTATASGFSAPSADPAGPWEHSTLDSPIAAAGP